MTLVLLGHSCDWPFRLSPDPSICAVASLVYDEILSVTWFHVPCPLGRLNSELSVLH